MDRDTEEVMNEFNFLSGSSDDSVDSIKVAGRTVDHRPHENNDWGTSKMALEPCLKTSSINIYVDIFGWKFVIPIVNHVGLSSNPVVSFSSRVGVHQTGVDREPVGTNLELGELEQLTINNDNESSSYEVSPKSFRWLDFMHHKLFFLNSALQ